MASGWRVIQYCSGFAAQCRWVTLHCCLPVVCDQHACTVLSLSWCVNVLYTFNATHTSRMTVFYAFNALPTLCTWRCHDDPDIKRLGNARARLGGRWAQLSKLTDWVFSFCLWPIARRETCGMWRRQSPPAPGGGSETVRLMATPKPSPAGGRAWCHGTHGDVRALLRLKAGLEPQDTWRQRNPPLPGGSPGATGHATTPESSHTGGRV
jgi:hypothetical protein